MNKNSVLFLFLILALTITSCKKELSGADTKKGKSFNVVPLDFEYLNTKSKIHFKNNDKDIRVTATIRIKKDSIIWFSLSPAFGIEAVRGIITRDSLKIVNRLEKEYFIHDFKSLSKKFNFNINFNLVQAMLLGDMPVPYNVNHRVSNKNGNFIVHQEDGNLTIDNFIAANKMKTERVQLTENSSENTLTLLYDNFQPFLSSLIPYNNQIILNYKEGTDMRTTLIDIDHGKAEIADSSLKFPFNIPQKYDQR